MEVTLFLSAKNAVPHMISYDLKIIRQECHIPFFQCTLPLHNGEILSASSHSICAV
jgi:hypothetical protein